ncbi:MAG: DUF3368 domain-containing protein [Candidatus Poribacteria bacterium]|nr:DUF3368 domain-containing protein [Candidatus Poribacteria bacterium]
MGARNGNDQPTVDAQLAIVDSSPLIALDQIGHLDLVRHLFHRVLAPSAVVREVSKGMALPMWIEHLPLTTSNVELNPPLPPQLGDGEREAILLRSELGTGTLILDDRAARRAALQHKMRITGTVGILVRAKQKGYVPSVRELLNRLTEFDFYVGSAVRREASIRTGELPNEQ